MSSRGPRRRTWPLLVALVLALVAAAAAQDPASSADRPPGNVNELTLAGLRPGQTTVTEALKRLGAGWTHPSPDEHDLYDWCDAATRLRVQIEAHGSDIVQVVTVERMPDPPNGGCRAKLPLRLARTGRGVALGAAAVRLRAVYGKPFFAGPASWRGRNVQMIVYNFSWAGSDKPQILESTFDHGALVKFTLSAQYY